MSLEEILKALYKAEINICISSFYDVGWDVDIGDDINGYDIENAEGLKAEEIAPYLYKIAKRRGAL